MKLQLDTQAKTVKVEQSVSLSELVEVLERLLPNGQWKEYQLETNVTIEWNSPTIIYRDRWPYYNPLTPYWYAGSGGTTTGSLSTCLTANKNPYQFNLEIN